MAGDLRRWGILVAVADEGHVGRAAERLRMAQPSVSQQVRRLEEDLGVRLLDRHARGVSLTSAGEAFLPAARIALAAEAEARARARNTGGPWRTSLRIGLIGPLPDPYVTRVLRRFGADHPDVELVTCQPRFPDHLAAVRDGSVDIAFVYPPYRADGSVRWQVVRSERRCVAVASTHPLAGSPDVRLEDVAAEPVVGFSVPTDPIWERFWTTADLRESDPAVGGRTDSITGLLALVGSGRAVAFFPDSARTSLQIESVTFLPLSDVGTCELALAWRTEVMTPEARGLVALAAAEAADTQMSTGGEPRLVEPGRARSHEAPAD
ncbi:MAG: LysR family transcriptional regulator, partial [Phycicoccus sp.]